MASIMNPSPFCVNLVWAESQLVASLPWIWSASFTFTSNVEDSENQRTPENNTEFLVAGILAFAMQADLIQVVEFYCAPATAAESVQLLQIASIQEVGVSVDPVAVGIAAAVAAAFERLHQSVHVLGELGYLLGVADHDLHPGVDQFLNGRELAVMLQEFCFHFGSLQLSRS